MNRLIKVNLGYLRCIHGLLTGYEMVYLQEPVINNKKIESMACYVWGKPNTKSMPTSIHKASGIGSGVYNLAFNKALLDL